MENLKNETEEQIVCLYLVQMLGQPTVKQIQKIMNEKMELSLNKIKVKNALDSAKKRGLLSVNHIQDPETEEVIDAYSMKDLRFSNPPEIAHVKNVLPLLLKDKHAKHIFDQMEGIHTQGEKKGGRLPDIRDYKSITVKFKNITPVLGGQPFGIGDKKVQATNKFRRIGDKIWIPNTWLKATIKYSLREFNINESKAMYLYISDIFFNPKGKIYQEICPSPPQRRGMSGTGLTSYEAIPPGEEFEFTIKFPTTNGISIEIMKEILSCGLRIGAKNKEYGLLEVIEIR